MKTSNAAYATAMNQPQNPGAFMNLLPSHLPLSSGVRALASAVLGLVVLAPLLAAQDLPFDSGSTGADGPLTFPEIVSGGRESHAQAYDPVRQQVVLFGGRTSTATSNDTWVWSGGDWTRAFAPTAPPVRSGHRMVWDAARGEVVLFGGVIAGLGTVYNDTWVWNGETWTQKTPATSPAPRSGFAMAYDAARQQVVLFGGAVGSQGTQETWLWDGNNWTLADPAAKPPGSGGSAMTYDAAREEIVLFSDSNQTWTWNGVNWTQRSSSSLPSIRSNPAMAYDPVRQVVLQNGGSGRRETWSWNGSGWTQLAPADSPLGTQFHAMVWDDARQRVVLFGGQHGPEQSSADTWLWDGSTWSFAGGKNQTFDMAGRPNGIWNFTTIDVPAGITVRFNKNAANTPVRWLATGNVTLDGSLILDGERGLRNLPVGTAARGGPGGFNGGRGAVRVDVSGSSIGSPGQGPGGGLSGTAVTPTDLRDGQPGQYRDAYGNVFLQPLLGGSGGGGGASSETTDGGNGAGGGGAIMIASSRDIFLNGSIHANGGDQEFSFASYGGRGSGGAILLRADRIVGNGRLEAFGGTTSFPNGRIRTEAYVRLLDGAQIPPAAVGLPAPNGELNIVGALAIASVDGANVSQPPSGNLLTPDVVFSEAGTINVVVNATGIPDGSPVTLRVATAQSVIQAGPVNLANGSATFGVTVPKGMGTLQAIAEFSR
jgi:hypothetical protein